MSFSWDSFLVYAQKLDRDGLDECYYRSGVSRAYYAAFHCAEEYIAKNNITVIEYDASGKKLKAHEKVWLTLQKEKDFIVRKIGTDGYGIRSERTRSDYDCDCCIDRKTLKKVCDKAQKIIDSCKELTASHFV